MTISPDFRAISVGQAVVGDLIFVAQAEDPILIVDQAGGARSILYTGEQSTVHALTVNHDHVVGVKVCDDWRFKLVAVIAGGVIPHAVNAPLGKIVLNAGGRFYRSTLGPHEMIPEALVDLDQSSIVDDAGGIRGDSHAFDYILEICTSGDTWEPLLNPLAIE